MKRGGPLKRRTPLRPMSEKRRAATREWPLIVAQVFRRDGYRCECRGFDTPGIEKCSAALHAHHVIRRSQGGSNALSNLVTLCTLHHRYVHDHPQWSQDRGLLVSASHYEDGTIPRGSEESHG